MSADVTIPISTLEVTFNYTKPSVKLMADRVVPVQALLEAFAPWHPALDDMEIIAKGKLTEQGVKFRIESQKASFFIGIASCKFVKDAANWPEADEILHLLQAALTALAAASDVEFGTRSSILSLHLQLKTVPFKDILRNFISPELLKLDTAPTTAMATVVRWPTYRVTLDGSAAIANGIFLQMEREFDADASFDEMKKTVHDDEVTLFRLLGVNEVEA